MPTILGQRRALVRTDYTLLVIGYNSKLVNPTEAPKNYSRSAQPEVEERYLDRHRARTGGVRLAARVGRGKDHRVYESPDAQRHRAAHGHTLQVQLLCSGETKIAVEVYAARIAQMKHDKGCPLEMDFPNPTPGSLGSHRGIAKSTKTPCRRALYRLRPERGRRRGLAKAGGLPAERASKGVRRSLQPGRKGSPDAPGRARHMPR